MPAVFPSFIGISFRLSNSLVLHIWEFSHQERLFLLFVFLKNENSFILTSWKYTMKGILMYIGSHFIFLFAFKAFDDEHCWEPYMSHGNFSSSDISYQLGTIVSFSCSPGFVMEQGSGTIECVEPGNPHWNDSEPVCKGGCFTHVFVHACVCQFVSFEKHIG